jgi:hypothetical protein
MEMTLHGTLRDQIVSVIAQKGPMEARELLTLISGYSRPYTIQGVYKELSALQERGIILRSKRTFALSLPWAIELSRFAARLVKDLSKSSSASELLPQAGAPRRSFHFTNLAQADDFWVHAVFVLLENSSDGLVYNWLPHPWFYLVNGHKSKLIHRALKSHNHRIKSIVGGKTKLDIRSKKLSCAGTYELFYRPSTFDHEQTKYYSVSDRYLLTLRLRSDFAAALERLYTQSDTSTKIEVSSVVEITSRVTDISVTIDSDPKRVGSIREKFERYFKPLKV